MDTAVSKIAWQGGPWPSSRHTIIGKECSCQCPWKISCCPGPLEFAIHTLVEDRLDTSSFEQHYRNDETGRVAYDPKILLKIVLLGYARGLISSRKIEQACRENVVFIALACGQQPDHSTIATFVSSLKDEILPLFRDVLLVCQEMDLLGGTFFALDGLKLPSNASKEWSGTRSELHRKKERLEARVRELLTGAHAGG